MEQRFQPTTMDISHLPHKKSRAVIINCSTKYFTTLALASTLKNTDLDILLIDCDSTDGSLEYLAAIRDMHAERVELIQLPLRPHGKTLDLIFRSLNSDYLLLVDSDLEIKDPAIVPAMFQSIAAAQAFGAGLLHASQWMTRADHGIADGTTYFMERMWIPLTLLHVERVREALDRGASFLAERRYRSHPISPSFARTWAMRFRAPILRDFPALLAHHRMAAGNPCVAEYDTGAIIHQQAKALGYRFEEIPFSFWNAVHHFDGVTRATHSDALRGFLTKIGILSNKVANNLSASENTALTRLTESYPGFLLGQACR